MATSKKISNNEYIINDLFSEIYLSFTETFNYIKLVWVDLHKDTINNNSNSHNSHNSQKLKSIYSIKEKIYDAPNRVYFNKYKPDDTTKYIHVFSDSTNKQILHILTLIMQEYPHYNWSNVKTYLKPFWLKSRKTADLFNSLLPLTIHYLEYKAKNIPRIVNNVYIKSIDELKSALIQNIDWYNLNKIEFELYNSDFIITIMFERLTIFDTIIHGNFIISVNNSYRNNKNKNKKTLVSRNVNRSNSVKNFVEILQIKTTHSYIPKITFLEANVKITEDPTIHVTNDSLNMINTYLELIKNIYKINKSVIHT